MIIQLQDLKLAVFALKKKGKILTTAFVIGILIGAVRAATMSVYTMYTAQASVYSATYGSYEKAEDGVSAMSNYIDVITSYKVCERAASLIGDVNITPDRIREMINASMNNNSYIVYINANSADSEEAIRVSNAVAQSFVMEISNITGQNTVQLLDEAKHVSKYDSGNRLKSGTIIFLAILGGVCLVLILQELFSDKVKSIEQCMEEDADEIIGIIPMLDEKK